MNFILRAILLIVLVACISCEKEQEGKSLADFIGNEMTIDYRILIGHPLTESQQQNISKIITETFAEVNSIYNKWNPDSEISKLNQLKANQSVHLSPALEQILKRVSEVVILTEGRFDPTIEPLQALWKKKLSLGKIPSEEEKSKIASAIGWHHIHIANGSFYKDHDLTQLDLGGYAKGYCVDLLVERLNSQGFINAYVEWGGEIRTSGKHPDNRPWRIFISRLGDTNPDNAIEQVDLVDQAIATSGDYLQYWKVDGATFVHIFNPLSLQPLMASEFSIASASVIAPSCALADGLATAVMLFTSIEEAQQWLQEIERRYPDLQFYLLNKRNEYYITDRNNKQK